MILCNTTYCIDKSVDNEFREWITGSLIPAIRDHEHLSAPLFTRILSQPEPEATSYALQFQTPDEKSAKHWLNETAEPMFAQLRATHGADRLLSFVTFMDIL